MSTCAIVDSCLQKSTNEATHVGQASITDFNLVSVAYAVRARGWLGRKYLLVHNMFWSARGGQTYLSATWTLAPSSFS